MYSASDSSAKRYLIRAAQRIARAAQSFIAIDQLLRT
jgi:hypothetical protein